MVRTGWKGLVLAAAASAVLTSSAVAGAQPKAAVSPPDPTKSAPRLVLPKVDVHAQKAVWETTKLDPATSAAVAQVIDAMHRLAAQVPPASVPPPVVVPQSRTAAKQDHPRPVAAATRVVVAPKPIALAQPATAADAHGLNGVVPGIQIRMPWRIP